MKLGRAPATQTIFTGMSLLRASAVNRGAARRRRSRRAAVTAFDGGGHQTMTSTVDAAADSHDVQFARLCLGRQTDQLSLGSEDARVATFSGRLKNLARSTGHHCASSIG